MSSLEIPAAAGLPPIALLNLPEAGSGGTLSQEELTQTQEDLIAAFAAYGVVVLPGEIWSGRAAVRFALTPAVGVRIERVLKLEPELQRAAGTAQLRVLPPPAGGQTVHVEIASPAAAPILLQEWLEAAEGELAEAACPLPLGLDVEGRAHCWDLASLGQALVAGGTEETRAAFLHTALLTWALRFTPEELRLVLLVSSAAEGAAWAGLPHLVMAPVDEYEETLRALAWVLAEVEQRYQYFAAVAVRSVEEFNGRADTSEEAHRRIQRAGLPPVPEVLPRLVVVVEELARLAGRKPAQFEEFCARLSLKAGRAGVHLVLTTGHTARGVLKEQLLSGFLPRVCGRTATSQDSRVVLGEPGAEKLWGEGELLVRSPKTTLVPIVKGATPAEAEIARVVGFWRKRERDPEQA